MTTEEMPRKLPPDASAVQLPPVDTNGSSPVRRLNKRTVAIMAAAVVVVALVFLASQMLGTSSVDNEQTEQATGSTEMVDDAEPAHIEEMMREQQNGGDKQKPDDLRAQLERWEEEQAPEEPQHVGDDNHRLKSPNEDPWETAREESRRRRAQAYFQENFGARTSGVFPQVGKSSQRPPEERTSPDADLENVSRRAEALRDWHRSASASARASPHVQPTSFKDAFFANRDAQPSRSFEKLQAPVSAYEIQAGTILTLVLETGINSDLPGLIKARFTSPVYDTVTGRHLLIPSGAYLVGRYNAGQTLGQDRLQVAWTRLLLPNGKSLQLGNLPGTDLSGASGHADQVDEHWNRIITGALLSSLFAGTAAAASGPKSAYGVRPEQAALGGVSDNVNDIGQTITERNLDIQPTITIRPGMKVAAFVREDLVLEPYDCK